jgi:hypothetical protein
MAQVAKIKSSSEFDSALATVETLALEDQEALVEVLNRRIADARRRALVREVSASRRHYQAGKVRRGSAKDLMAELRRS